MKKIEIFFFSISMLPGLIFVSLATAWEDKVTHKDLTNYASIQSILHSSKGGYLPKIGFNDLDDILPWEDQVCHDETKQSVCTIRDWLRYGAEKEDADKYLPILHASIRPLNHFHEPRSNQKLPGDLPGRDLYRKGKSLPINRKLISLGHPTCPLLAYRPILEPVTAFLYRE